MLQDLIKYGLHPHNPTFRDTRKVHGQEADTRWIERLYTQSHTLRKF